MIQFVKYTLKNGLRLIVHEAKNTPLIAVNILYDIGSKDEDPNKTGFAHLFEHLMFGGSENVTNYDQHIQLAGGENNAFTNNDYTNYYNIIPAENIETVLWLESDRMKCLSFSPNALDIQKRVVVEEFKETALNAPYGDVWHHLCAMAFQKHAYGWPTIGKDMKHIENATMEEVREFFFRYYRPDNAILVLSGNIIPTTGLELAQKWFGDIEAGGTNGRKLKKEPKQQKLREKVIYADVPAPALYLAFHMVERKHKDYYACDLLSDLMANGRSSRFFQKLYKEKKIFNHIDAYVSGSIDPGLFIIEGKINAEYNTENAYEAIWEELEYMKDSTISEKELQKIKNQIESNLVFSEMNVLNKAISLAYFEVLTDAAWINDEAEKYKAVTVEDIKRVANNIFIKENCSKLCYHKKGVKKNDRPDG